MTSVEALAPQDRELVSKLIQQLLERNQPSHCYPSLVKYLDLWQSEQELRGISKLTLYSYRQKVEDLLDFNEIPNELIVKEFLAKKQQSGACSGTIANYVKVFRSFFAGVPPLLHHYHSIRKLAGNNGGYARYARKSQNDVKFNLLHEEMKS